MQPRGAIADPSASIWTPDRSGLMTWTFRWSHSLAREHRHLVARPQRSWFSKVRSATPSGTILFCPAFTVWLKRLPQLEDGGVVVFLLHAPALPSPTRILFTTALAVEVT